MKKLDSTNDIIELELVLDKLCSNLMRKIERYKKPVESITLSIFTTEDLRFNKYHVFRYMKVNRMVKSATELASICKSVLHSLYPVRYK
jgi:hypothetical protein